MAMNTRFSFICSDEERRMIEHLAESLRRNQSDAMRWLLRTAVKQLATEAAPDSKPVAVGEQRTEGARPC